MKQLIVDTTAPPVLACLWWVLSRGWAGAVQRGQIGERTRKRQKIGFVIALILLYVAMFGTTAYRHLAALPSTIGIGALRFAPPRW